MKVWTIVGARPQFVKAAVVSRAVAAYNAGNPSHPLVEKIVHTGQHYDDNMSQVFFDELRIPPPAINLEVGSGLHGQQTGRMLQRLEQVLMEDRPDQVLIYGDTNSTLAAALAAAKLHIPIAHVEAGLRAYNRRIPEEINRVVADVLSALLLCPTETSVTNLAKEGITRGVHLVGDVMYDSVLYNAALAQESAHPLERFGLEPGAYYLATVHRANNTDDLTRLEAILEEFRRSPRPIILPLHPRTRKTLGSAGKRIGGPVQIIEPMPYFDMLILEKSARAIITDSGGVQKEAFWFGVPCVTLCDETEWVELVEVGWNRVAGTDRRAIAEAINWAETMDRSRPRPSLYGDGHAAERIVRILAEADV